MGTWPGCWTRRRHVRNVSEVHEVDLALQADVRPDQLRERYPKKKIVPGLNKTTEKRIPPTCKISFRTGKVLVFSFCKVYSFNTNRSPDLTIRSENGETFRGHKLAFNLVRISLF